MKHFIAALTVTSALGSLSNLATAQDTKFQEDFVNRTPKARWLSETNVKSTEKLNVDASLNRFFVSVRGKYPRLTEEQHSQGKATAELYTRQFN